MTAGSRSENSRQPVTRRGLFSFSAYTFCRFAVQGIENACSLCDGNTDLLRVSHLWYGMRSRRPQTQCGRPAPLSNPFLERNFMKTENTKAEKAKDPRSEILRFRVTPEERSRIEHKALSSYRTLSRYLRDCTLGKDIVVVSGIDALVSELRRIGNNLNQLARAVNSGSCPSTSELGEIQKGVKEIWQSLNSLSRDAR